MESLTALAKKHSEPLKIIVTSGKVVTPEELPKLTISFARIDTARRPHRSDAQAGPFSKNRRRPPPPPPPAIIDMGAYSSPSEANSEIESDSEYDSDYYPPPPPPPRRPSFEY
jgi:hypothetical protein